MKDTHRMVSLTLLGDLGQHSKNKHIQISLVKHMSIFNKLNGEGKSYKIPHGKFRMGFMTKRVSYKLTRL